MENRMTPKIDTAPVVREALDALRRQTGLEPMEELGMANRYPRADEAIVIRRGARTWWFNAEVKPWLDRTTIGLLKERIRGDIKQRLLITRNVTPAQADDLREMGLAFLDTAGNAFLDREDLYVFIKGQEVEGKGANRKDFLFRPAELKVLFALLCNTGLEAMTHHEIKRTTGVGLGTINRLLQALENKGYIINLKGHPRRLVRKKELVDQWVVAYPQRLRPKLLIGRFTTPPGWTEWKEEDLVATDAQWGGEVAAKYLTHYLKPETATLYATKRPDDLIIRYKLRKDPQGDVEILGRFWNFPNPNDRENVVPTLLVYADLMATGEDRNLETAQMLYEREFAGFDK